MKRCSVCEGCGLDITWCPSADSPCSWCDGKGYTEALGWPNWETALFFAFGIFVGVAVALQV